MNAATGARLLVVDDEVAHLRALCEVLQANGYQASGHSGATQALAALREAPFDLLLADLNMPGMDGVALLRAALAIDPALVGIIMTGEGTIASAVEAMRSGAFDYILKPFRLQVALPVLERALQHRKLRVDNAALEVQVRQQMEDLKTANSDLDAFGYSVSHDLRAPLQVVHGFSQALLTRHAAQLDEKGIHYLERIRNATGQMDQLVDGLLKLSRMGRTALERGVVDVTRLVEEVMDELRVQQPGLAGSMAIVGEGLVPANADRVLLRQVFVNLLSNACKFSAGCSPPRVEVGCSTAGGECVYFVRDNGVGFDVKYAQRLFEPFQRLHPVEDFTGLGIGLSIVQRIVQRHRGRIWAQSEVGKGACFYFTLP